MLPQATADHYRDQQRLAAVTVLAMRRLWRRSTATGGLYRDSWGDALPQALALMIAAQTAAARSADPYTEAVLEETRQDAEPVGAVNAAALVGVASDGRPLDSLMLQPAERAGQTYALTGSSQTALAAGGALLDMIVQTQVADAARGAEGVAIAARPKIGGYVRMLNPPSCSRCAVLAGKWFKYNQGFARHPRCDCRHIPSSESAAGDFRINATDYFDSLSPAEQAATFTKSGAEAIRLGADPAQVVNARRGMKPASEVLGEGAVRAYGRGGGTQFLLTSEGTTRRGIFGGLERTQRDGFAFEGLQEGRVRRSRRSNRARLMPESILEVARDRDDAIRLLKSYGYISKYT